MAKNVLFKEDWLDVVFENRNKSYGAYKLRKESSRTMTRALLGGICLFSSICVLPVIASNISNEDTPVESKYTFKYVPKTIDKEVKFDNVKLPETKVEKALPLLTDVTSKPEAPASTRDQVKFIALEVVQAALVDEEVATIDDFENADIGSATIAGTSLGTVVLNKVGTALVDEELNEVAINESSNSILLVVEENAEPFETFAKFNQTFVSRFRAPELGNSITELKVVLTFVVEKDGSLTDIKALRDPGYGAGSEAIRVIKTMPKWKPAKYNKQAVRSQFTLPITVRVQ